MTVHDLRQRVVAYTNNQRLTHQTGCARGWHPTCYVRLARRSRRAWIGGQPRDPQCRRRWDGDAKDIFRAWAPRRRDASCARLRVLPMRLRGVSARASTRRRSRLRSLATYRCGGESRSTARRQGIDASGLRLLATRCALAVTPSRQGRTAVSFPASKPPGRSAAS